jgi:hypothetical protein
MAADFEHCVGIIHSFVLTTARRVAPATLIPD